MLVHAGAGGVGIAAIQMAKRAGARGFTLRCSRRLSGASTELRVAAVGVAQIGMFGVCWGARSNAGGLIAGW